MNWIYICIYFFLSLFALDVVFHILLGLDKRVIIITQTCILSFFFQKKRGFFFFSLLINYYVWYTVWVYYFCCVCAVHPYLPLLSGNIMWIYISLRKIVRFWLKIYEHKSCSIWKEAKGWGAGKKVWQALLFMILRATLRYFSGIEPPLSLE